MTNDDLDSLDTLFNRASSELRMQREKSETDADYRTDCEDTIRELRAALAAKSAPAVCDQRWHRVDLEGYPNCGEVVEIEICDGTAYYMYVGNGYWSISPSKRNVYGPGFVNRWRWIMPVIAPQPSDTGRRLERWIYVYGDEQKLQTSLFIERQDDMANYKCVPCTVIVHDPPEPEPFDVKAAYDILRTGESFDVQSVADSALKEIARLQAAAVND